MSETSPGPDSARIYTRTGDDGETDLLGGQRVAKDDLRLEVLGTLDELNAHLAVARSQSDDDGLRDVLGELQDLVYVASAEVACADAAAHEKLRRTISPENVTRLETIIDDARRRAHVAPSFLFPTDPVAAALNVARTVARRAERNVVTLNRGRPVLGPHVQPAINRLSDALFALASLTESGSTDTKE